MFSLRQACAHALSFFHPVGVFGDEFAPVGFARSLGFLGGVLGVVDVLALIDGMADGSTDGIGGIKEIGILVEFQD